MSVSPLRKVTDELMDLAKPPFALGTPARERAARHAASERGPVQAVAWKSPKYTGIDRSPWHATKIVSVLKDALAPTATIEILLHSSHCLFLCASEGRVNRDRLRALTSLTALSTHIFLRSDDSHSGARVKEHVLNGMTMLLGEDAEFDNFVAFDPDWLSSVLPEAVLDRHATVVTAAARFLRRLSEIVDPPDAPRQLILNDDIFNALLLRYESCEDVAVRTHLMCALVNVTADTRVHFFLARCQRLLQILLDEVFSGGVAGNRIAAARWAKELAAAHGAGSESQPRTPGRATASSSMSPAVVKPRPGLTDVNPLYRYTRGNNVTVTGTPRIPQPFGLSSPTGGGRSAATSVAPGDPMTPKGNGIPSTTSGRVPHRHRAASAAAVAPPSPLDDATAAALTLCDLALRTFANLLSSEEQCVEIRRLAPTLMQAAVDCRAIPDEGVCASATEVLRRLHDLDSAQLDHEVSIEVMQGRALAQQLRSKIPIAAADDGPLNDGDDDDDYATTYVERKGALLLPDALGTHSGYSGRSTLVGSDAPTAYSSRGLGSAVSLVRRALADVTGDR